MKRGKDEEKIVGPMFPRLHVNDTEKGGPRAPPRNKMALYEQLSIPSQRFSHQMLPLNPNNAGLVPPSDQGLANERGMFYTYQLPNRHQSEKQYSQYSDLSTPLTKVKQRKKLDEDDFRVPIFVQSVPSQEYGKYTNDRDILSPSNHSNFNHPSERQGGKCQTEENPEEFSTDRVKAISNSSPIEKAEGLKKQTDSSLCHEPGDNPADSVDRLKTDDNVEPDLCAESESVLSENIATVDKRNSATSVRSSPLEDQNICHDLSNETESREDRSSRSLQMRNLERGDSVSESSGVDSISRPDITPDDVVGIIGQKRFWKARRAIANQQRVFAVQVFELHRLVKVQRLIAASPHLLLNDSAYVGKPMNSSPGKRTLFNYPVKAAIPDVSKGNGESEKPSRRNESLAKNTIGRGSFSSTQTGVPPPSCMPMSNNSQAPMMNSDHNARPGCFNQPHGYHWLIPVMSPSEGLIYKPYPGPGFVGPACGGGPPGSNPMMGNIMGPAYGVPAPHPQYQWPPSFPPAGPHGYFPPYGMPMMTLSGSSVDQMNIPSIQGQVSNREANADIHLHKSSAMPSHKNQASPEDLNNVHASNDMEVQASTESSPIHTLHDGQTSSVVEGRNILPLFPTSPAMDTSNSSPQLPQPEPEPERPTQVIKVVPHNARSATESAARIFRSIQEERRQYDSA
ncbi:UNVERIFIED_CONTAM: protein EARLY FLOWERING 3 [Sesamum angustifolium]|uniref:Protein EARLY FLOWERING 3 n=1 Tax=Sesamum angustifolium TaxID=2727405 RepID=A0AAW2M7Q1_9LAMI